jgi:DNA-binding transcriptional MerR regulator
MQVLMEVIMAYTVKKLAELSGVSVRTLHFYDEIGLLLPGFVGQNGYRYYKEEQLLLLQQILIFRELGFELKQIQAIVSQPDFDKVKALITHKEALERKRLRIEELIKTVDKTIQKINGDVIMNERELYQGFSSEEQMEYEVYLVNRYGDKAKKHIDEAKSKNWDKDAWAKASAEWSDIMRGVKLFMDDNVAPDADEVQALVKLHFLWLSKIWSPDKESYVAHAQGFVDLAWKKAFEPFDDQHPRLAQYFAKAAKVFAERNLS